jgi:hypothetical protein
MKSLWNTLTQLICLVNLLFHNNVPVSRNLSLRYLLQRNENPELDTHLTETGLKSSIAFAEYSVLSGRPSGVIEC